MSMVPNCKPDYISKPIFLNKSWTFISFFQGVSALHEDCMAKIYKFMIDAGEKCQQKSIASIYGDKLQ